LQRTNSIKKKEESLVQTLVGYTYRHRLSVAVLPREAVLLIIKNLNVSKHKYKILRSNQVAVSLIHSTSFSPDSEIYNNLYFKVLMGASFRMFQNHFIGEKYKKNITYLLT
jgi:hypothetical protein